MKKWLYELPENLKVYLLENGSEAKVKYSTLMFGSNFTRKLVDDLLQTSNLFNKLKILPVIITIIIMISEEVMLHPKRIVASL